MSRTLPECPTLDPSDRWIAADVLVQEDPDDEEDEKNDGDGEEDDEGYSE
jgi:hypothetical protein